MKSPSQIVLKSLESGTVFFLTVMTSCILIAIAAALIVILVGLILFTLCMGIFTSIIDVLISLCGQVKVVKTPRIRIEH